MGIFDSSIEFPPESIEWTFFVATLVILVGPVVAQRLRLPGIVGVVLGGLLVGPFVLEWVHREGVVESLGELGLLYLMFLAGLELDLDEFQRNRRPAVTFGGLTFGIPLALGLGIAIAFGYGFATALLYGSLWASHTLVSYPIVQEHDLTRHRAVGMASGGTVMTDTLALSVLAIVAGSTESSEGPIVILATIVLGLGLLAGYCAFVLTRIARWTFSGLGQQGAARFVFLLVALTSAALVADRMGLEGIIGAFFAGLALNRLVPARSQLMERVEFVGAALLIPFFLLSTGMLIDPEQFTEPRVLAIAGFSLAAVLVGKAVAAYVSGRLSGFNANEIGLVFGLTIAQAAATLATVTVGVDIGLFGDDLLSATIVVVLVTVMIAGIATRRAAHKLEPPGDSGVPLAATVLVPVEAEYEPEVVRVAARLAMAKGGTVLTAAVAPPAGEDELAAARSLAGAAADDAGSLGAEAASIVRIDASTPEGLASIAAEHAATLIVVGWEPSDFAAHFVLGGQSSELPSLVDMPVLVVVPGQESFTRAVLALDPDDLREQAEAELDLAIAVADLAVSAAQGDAVVIAPTQDDAGRVNERLGGSAEIVVGRPRIDAVAELARPSDLIVLPSRPGGTSLRREATKIAALPADCGVAVTVRPRTSSGIVTGTPLVLGRRAA